MSHTEERTSRTPGQVWALEQLRLSPFCRMFGCCELETVAQAVVQYLVEHGNSWDRAIPDAVFESLPNAAWLLDHTHGAEEGRYRCNFREEFLTGNVVNLEFLLLVTRACDGNDLREDCVRKLLPDWESL